MVQCFVLIFYNELFCSVMLSKIISNSMVSKFQKLLYNIFYEMQFPESKLMNMPQSTVCKS
jgi:hypothetical protein